MREAAAATARPRVNLPGFGLPRPDRGAAVAPRSGDRHPPLNPRATRVSRSSRRLLDAWSRGGGSLARLSGERQGLGEAPPPALSPAHRRRRGSRPTVRGGAEARDRGMDDRVLPPLDL